MPFHMSNVKKSNKRKKILSDDDVTIAKGLKDNNTLTLHEIAAKFDVTPATITNRLKSLNNEPPDSDNPLKQKELIESLNLLIILKKRLTTQLAQVDFDEYKSFDEITKALQSLTRIFTPLHAAYRAETQKTAATVISFTNIVERNWENDEKRKQKIVDVLSKKV